MDFPSLNHRGQNSGFDSLNQSTQYKQIVFWSSSDGTFSVDMLLDAPSYLLLVLVSPGVLYIYFCHLQLELLLIERRRGGQVQFLDFSGFRHLHDSFTELAHIMLFLAFSPFEVIKTNFISLNKMS